MPRISLGTWAHGGPRTVGGRAVGWSGRDDRAATAALLRAWESGITHWDTADVYGDGRSERLIGRLWDRVPRDQIFLATKLGWDPGPGASCYAPRRIRSRLESSLRHLRTDRVDLYYFHHCDFGPGDRELEPALEAMAALRAAGRFRFLGLSDWSSARIARLAPRVDPDVVQPYRNVLDDSWESSGLRSWVESSGAGVAFFSPLRHGLLLGKHREPPRFAEGDHRRDIPEFGDPALLEHLRRCREEVERRFAAHPQPVLHALTGCLLADAPTGCVLLGLRNPAQVEAAASLGGALPAGEAEWVRRLYRGG